MPDPTPPPAIDIDPADIVPPPTSNSAATATSTGAPALDKLVSRFAELSDTAGNPGSDYSPRLGARVVHPDHGPGTVIGQLHAGAEALTTGRVHEVRVRWDTMTDPNDGDLVRPDELTPAGNPGAPTPDSREAIVAAHGPCRSCGATYASCDDPSHPGRYCCGDCDHTPPTPGRSWVTTVWDALARDIDLGPSTVDELVHRIDDPMCGPAEVAWALRLLAVAGGAVAEGEPDGRWHLLVRPDPTSCICGPRGDGTGPYDGDPDPDCPEHGATLRPGPGVYESTELARAAAGHYGPDPVSAYHLLNQRLDTLLDVVRQRLTAIERRLPLRPDVARTLSAMDRVTQQDAEVVIGRVLLPEEGTGAIAYTADDVPQMAAEIAETLYGSTTEGAPVTTHQPGRDGALTWLDKWDTGQDTDVGELVMYVRFLLGVDPSQTRGEGAPTEGDGCGATLDQGCNATSDVHRCTHTATTYAHALTDGRPHHVCECGTRWPIEGDR